MGVSFIGRNRMVFVARDQRSCQLFQSDSYDKVGGHVAMRAASIFGQGIAMVGLRDGSVITGVRALR